MNKAYRVVFNKATGAWTAVSETACGRGKGRAAVRAVSSVLVASAAAVLAPSAMAQLVEQDPATKAITIGKGTDGTVVDIADQLGGSRTLTGVANGQSTNDAVNYRQLSTANTGIANALGGGASINTATGAVTAPTYVLGADALGNTTYHDVGSALGNLDSRILVRQDKDTRTISVAKDTDGTEVSFAGKDASGNPITRKLTNVTAGSLSATSTDAVNGSQLYASYQNMASALGGGAGISPAGVWTGPTYTVGGGTYHNVGDALTGVFSNLDGRVSKLEGAGGGGNGGGSGDSSGGSGGGSGGGAGGNERVITNVAEGTKASDAVNKAQLDRVDNKIADVQQSVSGMQSQIDRLDGRVNRVGAMSAAMSTMIASAAGLQTDNRMAIGTGLYRGQTALAIGYQRKVGSRATVTIGGSTAGGSEYNVGVGAGYGW